MRRVNVPGPPPLRPRLQPGKESLNGGAARPGPAVSSHGAQSCDPCAPLSHPGPGGHVYVVSRGLCRAQGTSGLLLLPGPQTARDARWKSWGRHQLPGAARVAGDAERDAAPERQVGCGRCGAHARLPGHGSDSRYATSLGPGTPSRVAPPGTPSGVLPSCGLSSGRLKPSPFPALLFRSGLVRACKLGASPPPSRTGPYSDSGIGASLELRGLEYWVRDPLLWFPEGFNLGSHHPAGYLK